jgi:hypothetical protein
MKKTWYVNVGVWSSLDGGRTEGGTRFAQVAMPCHLCPTPSAELPP